MPVATDIDVDSFWIARRRDFSLLRRRRRGALRADHGDVAQLAALVPLDQAAQLRERRRLELSSSSGLGGRRSDSNSTTLHAAQRTSAPSDTGVGSSARPCVD
jgi:hypothetical protein